MGFPFDSFFLLFFYFSSFFLLLNLLLTLDLLVDYPDLETDFDLDDDLAIGDLYEYFFNPGLFAYFTFLRSLSDEEFFKELDLVYFIFDSPPTHTSLVFFIFTGKYINLWECYFSSFQSIFFVFRIQVSKQSSKHSLFFILLNLSSEKSTIKCLKSFSRFFYPIFVMFVILFVVFVQVSYCLAYTVPVNYPACYYLSYMSYGFVQQLIQCYIFYKSLIKEPSSLGYYLIELSGQPGQVFIYLSSQEFLGF